MPSITPRDSAPDAGRRGLLAHWHGPRHPSPQGETLAERILHARGITDSAFLNPTLTQLHDPSLLPGIDRAAQRVLDALSRDESIAIYGDYDVDGISAAAILWHTLRAIRPDARLQTYLPHRLDEGYGLNTEALCERLGSCQLVVSVDCGITAVEPARAVRDSGRDLIITDHHLPRADGVLPEAFALVHPSLPLAAAYPCPDLSGAGVAFKLAWRLVTLHCGGRATPPLRALLMDMLALASMGIIADVVPLLGENRVIARQGLRQIAQTGLPGLRALRDESMNNETGVDAEAIAFRLGPRLNAVGRLGHAGKALEMLKTDDPELAASIAAELTHINDERRNREAAITRDAEKQAIQAGMDRPDRRAIVLAQRDWDRGIVGICCARLVERFCRPVILLQDDGDTCHGSGRSVDSVDLHGALQACSSSLISFGGHAMAAGVHLKSSRLGEFAERFIEHVNGCLAPDDLTPVIHLDGTCEASDLTLAAVTELDSLRPYGRGNPKPTLLLRGVRRTGPLRSMGKDERHIRFDVRGAGGVVRVKGWNWAKRLVDAGLSLEEGQSLDLVVRPAVNDWMGRRTVECEMIDLALPTSDLNR